MPRPKTDTVQVTVRVPSSWVGLADAVARSLSQAAHGVPVTNLAIYVMHVPGTRDAELAALLARVPGAVVMDDPDRNGVWWNARRCWEAGVASGAEWIIVLNDDALPCERFLDVASAALATRSYRDPVCFYTNHHGARSERLADGGWYTTHEGLVGVACALHRTTAAEFLEWHDRAKNELPYPDDARINLFAMATGRLVHTTVPSLVDHQLPDESMVGNTSDAHRRPVVPPSGQLARVDWTREPVHMGRAYLANHWDCILHVKPEHWALDEMYRVARNGVPVAPDGKPHVAIVVPTYRESERVARAGRMSRNAVRQDLDAHGIHSSVLALDGDSLVCRMRQRACHFFLESPATHLLFWDADIECLTPDCVRKMLATGRDVIAGACPYKDDTGRTVHNRWPDDEGKPVQVDEHGCVEVADAGTGFMLVSRRALYELQMRHPELQHWSMSRGKDRGAPLWALFDTGVVEGVYQSEDFMFCHLWQQAGGAVYVYAPARFRHWGDFGYEASFETQYGLEKAG